MSIKGKVLSVILSSAMGSLLMLSLAVMVSIVNIRRITLSHSDSLGEMAARDSQAALETQLQQQMTNLARDKAVLVNEKFRALENQTKMAAETASRIYTFKEQYHPKSINYLQPGEERTTVPHLMTAPGVSLSAIQEEVALAANITDVLRQFTTVDIGLVASYIGGESGYFIVVDKDASGFNKTDYDVKSRSWYTGAKDRDGLFWTEVFADVLGRGASISCAMPFYDYSGGKRVLKGVAGSGALLTNVEAIVNASVIGRAGYAFLLDDQGRVVISPGGKRDDPDRITGEDYLHNENPELRELAGQMIRKEEGFMHLRMYGEDVYIAYSPLEVIDFSLGIVMAAGEITAPVRAIRQDIMDLTTDTVGAINRSFAAILLIIAAVVVLTAGIALYFALRLSGSLTAPIVKLCNGAEIIGAGDLNYQLEVSSQDEIGVLAGRFNQMIRDIKTITGEKERLNGELSAAADIQNSMLPRIFPKFSERRELALYAKMTPAKEVGGDFYDFFYLDKEETQIACVIADVSGKGVPAALFMVIAKTLLKIHMLRGLEPAATLETVNRLLCEDNPQGMFVTVFLCTIDLRTGKMTYANGGHNPPLISLSGGAYQFMRLKKGVPLGMFEDSRYFLGGLDLRTGDRLYLYTDGMNEAMNSEGELFGNRRLLEKANACTGLRPEAFDGAVRQEIALFVNKAEQSDDITTLAIDMTAVPAEPMQNSGAQPAFEKELTLPASIDNLGKILDWIQSILADYSCSSEVRYQMMTVTEEIVVNIARYAYPGKTGSVTVRTRKTGKTFAAQYEDEGVPFNPLEWPIPDIKADLKDRKIGGLGIYLVRKMTDYADYRRLEGKNLLTVYKALE
ncbi:MAG: SpoIIE family protein phosphatase [Treponema sp.]|jgi:sigma-B regulation protein RsbU (phosphoserine phosphatase)|nr:SpoIIE family protein phosphatase [Treponema sp.]